MIYKPDTFPLVSRVLIDGHEVNQVHYVDTHNGIVRYYPKPYKIKRPEYDRLYSRTLRGNVTVELVQ